MSASPDEMTFSGEPLHHSPWTGAAAPAPQPQVPAPASPPAPDPAALPWLQQLRTQVVAAHLAALQAQRAILETVTGPDPRHGLAARAAPLMPSVQYRPDFADTEAAPAGLALDGQLPIAALLEVIRDRIFSGSPESHLLEGTLMFRADLPLEEDAVQWETGIDGAADGITAFHASCQADGTPVFEFTDGKAGPAGVLPARTAARRSRSDEVSSFKPLARTAKRSLDADDIGLLADGRICDVFGASYLQAGCNPSLRLPGGQHRMIDRIDAIDRHGGRCGLGLLSAVTHVEASATAPESLIIDGAGQVLQAYLLYLGAHLVLPDARFQPVTGLATQITVTGPIPAEIAALRYEVEIAELGLLDRPHAVADVTVFDDARKIMTIHDIGVQIREKPGTPYCPGPGGSVPSFLGRTNAQGERSMLSEFHMAHASKGDLAVAMGPEWGIYRESRAPYIPNGDFLFVDRMMEWQGERGLLVPGATMVTEYDSPPDSWYYQDNGHAFLPYCVLMETSLQSAVLLGYYLGATPPSPDEQFSIRNLDGHASVIRDVDLRGKTIRQHSALLSHHAMTGAVLQNFSYELSADGETFYTGESLFGYFSERALANQVGLDAGRYVAPWQDNNDADISGSTRRIDLHDDKQRERLTTGPGLRLGSGRLQLVDWVDLVPGGGDHGAGYLRGYRRITPEEWYFSCHFHRDPVMPGSLGVEAILQAMELYAIENGLAAGIPRARFALAPGVEMGWSYRGQILRTDPDMNFDVHIKEIRREPGRVLVIGDASLWKPGLRIYALKNIAIAIVSENG